MIKTILNEAYLGKLLLLCDKDNLDAFPETLRLISIADDLASGLFSGDKDYRKTLTTSDLIDKKIFTVFNSGKAGPVEANLLSYVLPKNTSSALLYGKWLGAFGWRAIKIYGISQSGHLEFSVLDGDIPCEGSTAISIGNLYSLNLNNVDPLKWGYNFERLLIIPPNNPGDSFGGVDILTYPLADRENDSADEVQTQTFKDLSELTEAVDLDDIKFTEIEPWKAEDILEGRHDLSDGNSDNIYKVEYYSKSAGMISEYLVIVITIEERKGRYFSPEESWNILCRRLTAGSECSDWVDDTTHCEFIKFTLSNIRKAYSTNFALSAYQKGDEEE